MLLGLLVIFPPRPRATWDHSPDAVIVEMDTTGSFYISDNHIPLFRLWGDGTLLWVEDNAPRQVLRGTLTIPQTAALIDDIIDLGSHQNRFAWLSPCDISEPPVVYTTLWLELLEHTEYRQYPDEALEKCSSYEPVRGLLARLADGAGAEGREYVPDEGHLFAYAAAEAGCAGAPSLLPEWPSAQHGFTLASAAAQDRWIQGDALRHVWQAIAIDEFCANIREGDEVYTVFLSVPGVTIGAPHGPAPR